MTKMKGKSIRPILVIYFSSVVTLKFTHAKKNIDFSNQFAHYDNASSFFDAVQSRLREHWGEFVNLDLSHNNLTFIPGGFFQESDCRNLRSLDLSHNSLKTVSPGWLGGLNTLHHLSLAHNALSNLSSDCLAPSLRILNLAYNRLTSLQAGVFPNLSDIGVLNVSHNAISLIHPGVFHPGISDQNGLVIDLSHNRLETFEPWPYSYPNAQLVDLSHNAICRFTNSVKFIITKEFFGNINLMHNKLTGLRMSDFSLYLGDRRPDAMEVAFKFKWNISNNPFICDCHMFWVVELMNGNLLVSNQEMQNYFTCGSPASLKGRALGYLLDHPDVLQCEEGSGCPVGCRCAHIPNRKHLAVTCDPGIRNYTRFPKALPGQDLLSLNLSKHALTRLEQHHPDVPRLQVLDVSSNAIHHLSPAFLQTASGLQVLHVENNLLTSVPPGLQKLMLQNVHLEGNPLRCSCDLVWLAQWIKAVSTNASAPTTVSPPIPAPQHEVDAAIMVKSLLSKKRKRVEESSAREASPDAFGLTCILEEGGTALVAAASEWGTDCGSKVAVRWLIGGGVLLVVIAAALLLGWRQRYLVHVMLTCMRASLPHGGKASSSGDEVWEAESHQVYVSLDEEDERAVHWAQHKLLAWLEHSGRASLTVYLPLRQELIGEAKAESRARRISRSSKVLVLLSSGYANNGVCRHELDVACHDTQQDNNKLVIVLLDTLQATTPPLTLRQERANTPQCCSSDYGGHDRYHSARGHSRGRLNAKKNEASDNMAKGKMSVQENEVSDNSAKEELVQDINIADARCHFREEENADCKGRDRGVDETFSLRQGRQHDNPVFTEVEDGNLPVQTACSRACVNDANVNNTPSDQHFYSAGETKPIHTLPNHRKITAVKMLRELRLTRKKTGHDTAELLKKCCQGKTQKTKPLSEKEKCRIKQLETWSRFQEGGQLVTVEPLRSFLMEGRYLLASESLFRYKLLYELTVCIKGEDKILEA